MYPGAASLSAQKLRQAADRVQLRAEQVRGQNRQPGEAALRPRTTQLQIILDTRHSAGQVL